MTVGELKSQIRELIQFYSNGRRMPVTVCTQDYDAVGRHTYWSAARFLRRLDSWFPDNMETAVFATGDDHHNPVVGVELQPAGDRSGIFILYDDLTEVLF